MKDMPDLPVIEGCPCYSDGHCECACGPSERVLRAIVYTGGAPALTPEQREWCLSEIGSVEGYARKDYEAAHDVIVARGVLDAWTDYARDKGVL